MNNSMIGATAGASSPSKLAPETIRIRNALIEKYADQPIEELNKFLQNALEAEKDELRRLGLLAARVYILRQKVISLKAFIRDERMDKIPTPNLALTEQILLDETAHSDIDADSESVASGEWHSLQMVEPGEVNGVRFFQGTIINAKAADAEKLISSGKAIVIDEDGNPVENNTDNISDTQDTLDSGADANDEGIILDDKSADDSDPLDAAVSVDGNGNNNAVDPKTDVVDEAAAVDPTDDNSPLDEKNADAPDPLDATASLDDTDNSNMIDPKADIVDEATAIDAVDNNIQLDEKNTEKPNIKASIEDTAEESTKNRNTDGSEETKA